MQSKHLPVINVARYAIGTVLACVLYQTAQADNTTTVRPENVLSVVTADWNNDGSFDRALLIASETESDQADLWIYLSDSSGNMQLATLKKNTVWRGAMWGTQPTLDITGHESLAIISANDAIGRNRWNQKLTVVYRDKAFAVAGYTHTDRDTLTPDPGSSCDVNFLTGKGIKDNKPFKISTKTIALESWSEKSIPQMCR